MKPLPKRLATALDAIRNNPGEDINFTLGYLNPKTASSYASQLKKRGLAYTHRSGHTTEAWPHRTSDWPQPKTKETK